ncbi:MAG: hypothetical protein JSV24_12505 [Bacteroidales bacterium]|nr:MAG: hypothetical protein JSV24_12505 [Bacteroidales bacterium]
MKKSILVYTFLPIFCFGQFITAQERTDESLSRDDSIALLRKELLLLKERYDKEIFRLDSLLQELHTTMESKEKEAEFQKLLDQANQLASKEKEEKVDLSKKFHSGTRTQQGLNPNISLGGDFFGAYSSSNHKYISEPGDMSYGNNGFFLREAEVALVAPLDPFTRGKTFFSITKNDISIEEAYMEWLNLPLNINLKTGIFYAEFGPLNRYHDHALPQFDRPRALTNLFSNSGLGGFGMAANFLLPKILFADATSFDISVINGGNDVSFDSNRKAGMLFICQFKNYYDLSRNSYFEFRLSGVTGTNDLYTNNRSYIGSLGLIYKWTPVGREKYRTFDWKTEIVYSYREEASGYVQSKGFYSSFQNKLSARFWLGGRIGYSELPDDNQQYEWDYTFCFDFWQSEFVFTRFQYQYNWRNRVNWEIIPTGMLPHDHSFIIQVCWAMGPHKHEAY